ncbi:MAG TPA: sigma-70 family RNA polymerase sigma factor [Polyangia bacterium]
MSDGYGSQSAIQRSETPISDGFKEEVTPAGFHSIEAIYEAEFDNLWRSLRRLGVAEPHLEDAIQEVFLAAHARLHTFDRTRPIRPWLFGIAVRVAAEMRRHHLRAHPQREAAEAMVALDLVGPEEALAARQAQALIDEALSILDFDQRTVMVMHDLENISAPAIAETLSLSVNTVYSRLRLAREKVTAFLRRRRGRP